MTPDQIQTLRLLCDTIVPALERPEDPDGFWARRATDVGADQGVLAMISGMPPEQQAGLAGLFDVLAASGFHDAPGPVLAAITQASPEAAAGIGALTSVILLVTYGITDAEGRNPFWTTIGYPGPVNLGAAGAGAADLGVAGAGAADLGAAGAKSADLGGAGAGSAESAITPLRPEGDVELEADAVVIGSGAGGGLIAGRLAAAGKRVIIVEAGRYSPDTDFDQLELPAYQRSYWRGGPTPTGDGNITLMAGAGLGGGTVINWTNCIRTKDHVRQQWADEYGLTDVATPEFDKHLDAVWREMSVNDRCSEFNKIHEAMQRGAEKLGWSFATVYRNWDEKRHDPAIAGHLGFGDRSGAKQSTLKVYIEPAVRDHGAQVIDNCRVDRIFTENGRAAGIIGNVPNATVTVRAPIVVVAAGALESPGVLLRSGIGGPAVGDYLRLHPCTVTMGDYGTDMRGWWGAPQAGLVNEFASVEDGYGFLMESVQYTTALAAGSIPFISPEQHKEAMATFRNNGSFIGLIRDRGHGRVTLDGNGNTVAFYELTDELDVRNARRAIEAEIRLHHAAGARRIQLFAHGLEAWQEGDDLEAYIARATSVPLRAGGATLFAAHQMGSCRMGSDPATSVADPRGELHDTPGVWIGDASAFPTPSGTNPMITVMALASRTAENIIKA